MAPEDPDRLVRGAAFAWLDQQVARRGEVLPRALLQEGFSWEGHRVPLMGPQGIFKPAILPEIPLSVTTVLSSRAASGPTQKRWALTGSCATAIGEPTRAIGTTSA